MKLAVIKTEDGLHGSCNGMLPSEKTIRGEKDRNGLSLGKQQFANQRFIRQTTLGQDFALAPPKAGDIDWELGGSIT